MSAPTRSPPGRLRIERRVADGTWHFEGVITVDARHELTPDERQELENADLPKATMGDKLRALAALFDAGAR